MNRSSRCSRARDAVILVAIVVLVFLQNCCRDHSLAAVPVAIVGTFAVMAAMA